MEAPLAKILSIIEETFNKNSNDTLSLQNDEQDQKVLNIQIITKISAVKFNYLLELKALDNSSIYRQLVHPLLLNYYESQTRENELIKIIEFKDKELEDYRAQGLKLPRSKNLKNF